MKEGQKLWTREELILAMNLYCKIPFGKMHSTNPEIKKLAQLIGRTPASVGLKLGNLASFDPSLQARGIKGASNASKLDREIWDEFYNNWDVLPYESEKLLANIKGVPIEVSNELNEEELPKEGKERERLVKVRVNQSFFRKMVLVSYNNTCCITGIQNPELLVAGHIHPWSQNEKNRMNPRNGMAMNPLHDKAFENGLITITPEYKIKIAPILLKETSKSAIAYFHEYHDQEIKLPTRFLPDLEFLKYHNENRFKS